MTKTSVRKRPRGRELKSERLELRITRSTKDMIQRAMAISGASAGDLARERAHQILSDHERMELEGANRDAFLQALLNPPEPSAKLIAALRRHRALLGE